MAPIIKALKKEPSVVLSVCKTGQHTDMVDSVFKIFGIEADVDFSIMGLTDNLNDATALLLKNFQTYFSEFKPDIVFVQGDTVSVLAGTMAAFNLKIDTAHVEAGLRTGNLASPWPEEGFRSMMTPTIKYHFAPTEQNARTLSRLGVESSNVYVTGNTVIDALHLAEALIEKGDVPLLIPDCVRNSQNVRKILITGHRRENFGEGLDNLCRAIARLAERYPETDFVFPVHLNPIVQGQVNAFFDKTTFSNVLLIEPQSYLEFVWLMKQSHFIITDSGGIQEEAPGLGKPVLVTRDTTERPEGVDAGMVKLLGTSEEALYEAACILFDNEEEYRAMAQSKNPYGDGYATGRILKAILK